MFLASQKISALVGAALILAGPSAWGEVAVTEFEKPLHGYWTSPLRDPFTQWVAKYNQGGSALPAGDEKAFVRALLAELNIPESSQRLVYSATSLQQRIGPYNPRALFFNEQVFLGWVPGGKLEVLSFDPVVGPVFHLFDFPRGGGDGKIMLDRSKRCINCHAGADSGHLPALVMESAIVSMDGGTLESFRGTETGHDVPLESRFGGYHVTGRLDWSPCRANLIGRLDGGLILSQNPPGKLFSWERYLRPTSNLLPQLVHEHQVGFINRVTQAIYRERALSEPTRGGLKPSDTAELDQLASGLVRYVLFADEARLPAGGVENDAEFQREFQRNRVANAEGASLKDFDLKTRIFKYRCSYMVYTPVWRAVPPRVKAAVRKQLSAALTDNSNSGDFSYLGGEEKKVIRSLLPSD